MNTIFKDVGRFAALQLSRNSYSKEEEDCARWETSHVESRATGASQSIMPNVMRDPLPLAATAFVALFWAGALAGVSFLATPVKFQAMSLTLPVALEVGRVTFALFTRFEWGLALLLAMAVFLPIRHAQKYQGACAAAVILLVLVEALWLLPALDARVDAVIGGIPLRPSPHHGFYTVAEGTKLVLLGTIAALSLFELGWRTATPSRSLIMTRELQVP